MHKRAAEAEDCAHAQHTPRAALKRNVAQVRVPAVSRSAMEVTAELRTI